MCCILRHGPILGPVQYDTIIRLCGVVHISLLFKCQGFAIGTFIPPLNDPIAKHSGSFMQTNSTCCWILSVVQRSAPSTQCYRPLSQLCITNMTYTVSNRHAYSSATTTILYKSSYLFPTRNPPNCAKRRIRLPAVVHWQPLSLLRMFSYAVVHMITRGRMSTDHDDACSFLTFSVKKDNSQHAASAIQIFIVSRLF